MSHSKRNTSRPVFTSHERNLAKNAWASKSARLNRDSFLPFGSCCLCLGIARDPVACRRGDIFCRECALANLLAQKKEIKRAGKAQQHAHSEMARLKALEDQQDRDRAIRDFELTQAGLDSSAKPRKPTSDSTSETTTPTTTITSTALIGTKRKVELDDDELARIAEHDKARARKAIDDEKATKPTLPSFWTPSLTPDAEASRLQAIAKKTKTIPTCPASAPNEPHSLSMTSLVTLSFREEDDSAIKSKRKICPSCLKQLSNSSSPMMAKQCGHVVCQSCVKKFMVSPTKQASGEDAVPATCYVCDTRLVPEGAMSDIDASSLVPGLVKLRSEGTGFSAKGTSTVERSSVAFQC